MLAQVTMAQRKHTAPYLLRRLGIYRSEILGALMSLAMYLCWGVPPRVCHCHVFYAPGQHLCCTAHFSPSAV